MSEALQEAAHDELQALAEWCRSEAVKRDPVRLKEQEEAAKRIAAYRQEQAEKADKLNRIVAGLKTFLKPGMKLKMRGCKDGSGIREFIKWDGDYLVCWQISRQRRYIQEGMGGRWVTEETKTNQVTTHMADKVARIFVDGTGLQVKSILK